MKYTQFDPVMHPTIALDEFEDEWPWPTFDLLFQVAIQNLVSMITSDFLHRFTHNLNLGWVPTWMTLTYIWSIVLNRNEWQVPVPTCCKLHAHIYTCIPKKKIGRQGTLDPSGQLVSHFFVVRRNSMWYSKTCLKEHLWQMPIYDRFIG